MAKMFKPDYIETTFPMTNKPFKGSIKKMLNK